MYLFIETDNGSGWVSRGGEHLMSSVEFARKFKNQSEIQAGLMRIFELVINEESGWEETSILKIEVCALGVERECVYSVEVD